MSISKTNDYFTLDNYRTRLVKRQNVKELLKTYKYETVIKNPNTNVFWNKKIKRGRTFEKLDPMSKERITKAVKMIKSNGVKILDIGFGYGYFEQKLQEKYDNFQLYGLDVSTIAVDDAKKKYGKNFFVGSPEKLRFKSNFFDYVVSFECLEHIPANNIFTVLKEIKRVLKDDGRAIFSVPINEKYTLQNNPNNHLRRYSSELFLKELVIAGFKIEKVIKLFAFNSYYSLKKLIRPFLPYKWNPNVILVLCHLKI